MCVMCRSASGVGACGKSNNVVMLLPPSKLARKFLPGLLALTAVPRIPNVCVVSAAYATRAHTHTRYRRERKLFFLGKLSEN